MMWFIVQLYIHLPNIYSKLSARYTHIPIALYMTVILQRMLVKLRWNSTKMTQVMDIKLLKNNNQWCKCQLRAKFKFCSNLLGLKTKLVVLRIKANLLLWWRLALLRFVPSWKQSICLQNQLGLSHWQVRKELRQISMKELQKCLIFYIVCRMRRLPATIAHCHSPLSIKVALSFILHF